MILLRKIKCKMGYHKNELFPVTVQPILISRWPNLNNMNLPRYETWMWICKYCKKERIIYK